MCVKKQPEWITAAPKETAEVDLLLNINETKHKHRLNFCFSSVKLIWSQCVGDTQVRLSDIFHIKFTVFKL